MPYYADCVHLLAAMLGGRLQDRVLEPVRKMLGLDEKAEGAFGSEGYLPHGLPSRTATTNMMVQICSVEKMPGSRTPLVVRSEDLWARGVLHDLAHDGDDAGGDE